MDKKIILLSLFWFLFFSVFALSAGAQDYENVQVGTLEHIELPSRASLLKPDKVMKAISILPGMTIADIGAGSGLFTFFFADALKGTGRVYATEIFPELVDYMHKKAQEQGYKNVFPVLVKRCETPSLYREHTFDIILLCEVYEILWHPEQFMKDLQPTLKKNTGRLYIIYFKGDPDFQKVEFDDFNNVSQVLIEKGEDFPVFKRLSGQNKDFVRHWDGGSIPEKIQEGIVGDFNKMLSDRLLFNELVDYYADFETHSRIVLDRFVGYSDRRLVQWLFTNLDKDRVFDTEKGSISEIDRKGLHRLNRIVIMNIFRDGDKDFLDIFGFRGEIFPSKRTVISSMEKSGYTFVRERDILPMHYFLEFKRKD